jgi:hypothetical protein
MFNQTFSSLKSEIHLNNYQGLCLFLTENILLLYYRESILDIVKVLIDVHSQNYNYHINELCEYNANIFMLKKWYMKLPL